MLLGNGDPCIHTVPRSGRGALEIRQVWLRKLPMHSTSFNLNCG